MIICHQYKFVFIKTMKTAGTSLELALMNACGPEDIVTPIVPSEPAQRAAKNLNLNNVGFINSRTGRKRVLRQHSPLWRAAELLGNEIFEYAIVTSERNPWQKLISSFFWKLFQSPQQVLDGAGIETVKTGTQFDIEALQPVFRRFVRSPVSDSCDAFDLYGLSWVPLTDYTIRFEKLSDDLAAVVAALNLPDSVRLPRIEAKGNIRPSDAKKLEFDTEMDSAVRLRFARELAAFGYKKNGDTCPPIKPFENRKVWRRIQFDKFLPHVWEPEHLADTNG